MGCYSPAPLIAPLTAFLLLRGLMTLELRMERHCSSALATSPSCWSSIALLPVSYPGLAHFAIPPVSHDARWRLSAVWSLANCEAARKRAWPSGESGSGARDEARSTRDARPACREYDPFDLHGRRAAEAWHQRRTHPLFHRAGNTFRFEGRHPSGA